MSVDSGEAWTAVVRVADGSAIRGCRMIRDRKRPGRAAQHRPHRLSQYQICVQGALGAAGEARPARYAVVARMTASLKRTLGGSRYERLNPRWEIAEFEHRASDWTRVGRCIVARFYDVRAGMKTRIRELREGFALRKIPTRAFAANTVRSHAPQNRPAMRLANSPIIEAATEKTLQRVQKLKPQYPRSSATYEQNPGNLRRIQV